jgi:hypothetical protein
LIYSLVSSSKHSSKKKSTHTSHTISTPRSRTHHETKPKTSSSSNLKEKQQKADEQDLILNSMIFDLGLKSKFSSDPTNNDPTNNDNRSNKDTHEDESGEGNLISRNNCHEMLFFTYLISFIIGERPLI